jgi:hypothetical protein
MGKIDLYCERVAAGLFAEPLNAVTNIAFFVAAWLLWQRACQSGKLTPGVRLLLAALVAFGIGSSLFHTFATPITRIFDVLPIALFMVIYMGIYLRTILNVSQVAAILLLGTFLVVVYFSRQFPHVLNGSLFYAPALAVVVVFGFLHLRRATTERWALLGAGATFFTAVVFRTIDSAVCPYWTIGTHFLWHLFVAVALYIAGRSLLSQIPRPIAT